MLTADIYEPTPNPLYRDVLAHYGAVALPCRVNDPDRKGKVESAIAHTQAALKGLRFETLEAVQAYLDRWDARWADTRIHGTTTRQVAAMFAEGGQPSCRCRSSRFATISLARAPSTSTASSKSTTPTMPRPRAGWAARSRCSGTACMSASSIPPGRAAARASAPGPRAAHHARRGSAHAYAADDPHAAGCAAALACEVASYRFIRRYLDHHPAAALTLRQVDPLIRDLTHYRAVIAQKTQEEIPT